MPAPAVAATRTRRNGKVWSRTIGFWACTSQGVASRSLTPSTTELVQVKQTTRGHRTTCAYRHRLFIVLHWRFFCKVRSVRMWPQDSTRNVAKGIAWYPRDLALMQTPQHCAAIIVSVRRETTPPPASYLAAALRG
jgi:hypothetical protein